MSDRELPIRILWNSNSGVIQGAERPGPGRGPSGFREEGPGPAHDLLVGQRKGDVKRSRRRSADLVC